MKIRVIITVVIAIMLAPALSAAGDIVIIGNPSAPESQLSKKDVKNIFLGKKKFWDDKSKVIVVIQQNPAAHEAFLKQFIHKTPSQFDAIWKKLVFTGKRSAPQAFDGDGSMMKYISENKGAIGYVPAEAKLNNVKTISVK
jgi:ABC-type phosphate transport system substrate-binding protein